MSTSQTNQIAESKTRTDAQLKSSLDKVEAQRQAARELLIKMGQKPSF